MESWGAERLDATRHIITDYNVISLGKDCGPRPAYKLRALDGQPVSAASLPRGPCPRARGGTAGSGVARHNRGCARPAAAGGAARSCSIQNRTIARAFASPNGPSAGPRPPSPAPARPRAARRGAPGHASGPRGDTNRPCSPGKRKARVAPPPVRGHGDVITQFEIRVSRAYAATRAPGRGAGHAACVYAMWAGTRI